MILSLCLSQQTNLLDRFATLAPEFLPNLRDLGVARHSLSVS